MPAGKSKELHVIIESACGTIERNEYKTGAELVVVWVVFEQEWDEAALLLVALLSKPTVYCFVHTDIF